MKNIFVKIKQFIIEWNEFVLVPLSILLFWVGGDLIRTIDPAAGLFDAGIFQALLFAIASFLLLHGVAWFVFKLTFPKAYKYLSIRFEEDIEEDVSLTIYQKCKLVLSYLLACLLALILLLSMMF